MSSARNRDLSGHREYLEETLIAGVILRSGRPVRPSYSACRYLIDRVAAFFPEAPRAFNREGWRVCRCARRRKPAADELFILRRMMKNRAQAHHNYSYFHTHVHRESLYGSPANFSVTKTAGFKTSSRSCLLKYGVPRHPAFIDG